MNEWKEHAWQYPYFIGMRPRQSISALVQNVKTESNKWIKNQVNDVVRYIQNREIHHRKETFLDKYRKFLTAFEIEWEEKYIFKELE